MDFKLWDPTAVAANSILYSQKQRVPAWGPRSHSSCPAATVVNVPPSINTFNANYMTTKLSNPKPEICISTLWASNDKNHGVKYSIYSGHNKLTAGIFDNCAFLQYHIFQVFQLVIICILSALLVIWFLFQQHFRPKSFCWIFVDFAGAAVLLRAAISTNSGGGCAPSAPE